MKPRRALVLACAHLLCCAPTCLWSGQDLGTLAVFEGQAVTAITLEGNRMTREFIFHRELRTRVGRPLKSAELAADLQRLDNLDIFSSLRATGVLDGEGVALTIHVRELPFAVPYISYEISDEDGLSIGPALRSVNMAGRDIFVAGFAYFGGRTSYLLDARDPWVAGNHLSLGIRVARIERTNELDGFKQSSFELSPEVGAYVGQTGRVGVGFSFLRVESDTQGHTLSRSNEDGLFRLRGRIGFDSRDSWSNPHRGWLNEIQVIRTGGGILPGDGDFWTAEADVRRFQPLNGHTLVLAGLMSLQSGKVGKTLPEYLDYHLGGANSIRGYDVKGLGRTLHGRHQLLTTIEYRVTLIEPREIVLLGQAADLGLSGALFTDTGIAWSETEQLSPGRARTGLGAGLRLLLPAVEMTRLDVAIGEAGWRVAFATFSKMSAQRLWLR